MNTTCEHGNMITHYQMNIYGCDVCDRALQDQYDDEDVYDSDNEDIEYESEDENLNEELREARESTIYQIYQCYWYSDYEGNVLSWTENMNHCYKLYKEFIQTRNQLLAAVNQIPTRRYFKNQITEELIASVMKPCRIEAQMNQFDNIDDFFETMGY